ncbi:MAG: beta-ketoacyl synthase N-terminal-like domain-containing protein, partial [Gammaproteobacteria bacterium]
MSKQVQDAWIVAAQRTPIGKAPKGVFRHTRPDDLLVNALRGALAQVPSLDPAAIEDAIVGCAIPEGQQGLNVGRMAVLLAGLPDSVGGATVNRFCASGLTALAMAADRIRVGEADVVIAGGTESMSMLPMMGSRPSINPRVFEDDHIGIAYGMGLTAEKVAQQWKVSREAQDAFALASHQKALKAIASGEFKDEIVPITVTAGVADAVMGLRSKEVTVENDEGIRPGTTKEGISGIKPAIPGGVIAAG